MIEREKVSNKRIADENDVFPSIESSASVGRAKMAEGNEEGFVLAARVSSKERGDLRSQRVCVT